MGPMRDDRENEGMFYSDIIRRAKKDRERAAESLRLSRKSGKQPEGRAEKSPKVWAQTASRR